MTTSKWLGSTHGVGVLLAEGTRYIDISYLIEVWLEQNGMTRTVGLIDARTEAIEQIRQTEGVILTLETGEKVPIIITGEDSGHAEIRILGPVASLAHYRGIPHVNLSSRS